MKKTLSLYILCFVMSFSVSATTMLSLAAEQESQETQESSDEEKATTEQTKTPEIKKRPEIIAPTKIENIHQQDLNHYLSKGDIEDMLVGPESHITLVKTHNSESPKGVIILLPEWQQHASSPQAINFLRKQLPEHGWTTIALQPLPKPTNYPSITLDDLKREEENKTILEQYQQNLEQLFAATIEKAKSYPGIIVVVAQGQNAVQLLSIFHKAAIDLPTAYVMLSGYMPTQPERNMSAEKLAELELQVLDLYLKSDHGLVAENAALRIKRVKQLAKSQYRQRQLFNINAGYYTGQPLIKEINGWLTSIGW